jgi:hypothetical protein
MEAWCILEAMERINIAIFSFIARTERRNLKGAHGTKVER